MARVAVAECSQCHRKHGERHEDSALLEACIQARLLVAAYAGVLGPGASKVMQQLHAAIAQATGKED